MDIVTNIPQENLINDQTQLLIKNFKILILNINVYFVIKFIFQNFV